MSFDWGIITGVVACMALGLSIRQEVRMTRRDRAEAFVFTAQHTPDEAHPWRITIKSEGRLRPLLASIKVSGVVTIDPTDLANAENSLSNRGFGEFSPRPKFPGSDTDIDLELSWKYPRSGNSTLSVRIPATSFPDSAGGNALPRE